MEGEAARVYTSAHSLSYREGMLGTTIRSMSRRFRTDSRCDGPICFCSRGIGPFYGVRRPEIKSAAMGLLKQTSAVIGTPTGRAMVEMCVDG